MSGVVCAQCGAEVFWNGEGPVTMRHLSSVEHVFVRVAEQADSAVVGGLGHVDSVVGSSVVRCHLCGENVAGGLHHEPAECFAQVYFHLRELVRALWSSNSLADVRGHLSADSFRALISGSPEPSGNAIARKVGENAEGEDVGR